MNTLGLSISTYLLVGILYYFLGVFPILNNLENHYLRKRKRLLRKKHSEIRVKQFSKNYADVVDALENVGRMMSKTKFITITATLITLFWPILIIRSKINGIKQWAEFRRQVKRKKGGWK